MPMLRDPTLKYEAFEAPNLPDRQWPSRKIKKAPRWLATDLRDGNQSLASPMTVEQKWRYFKMLITLGFKEIDVSFPGASQTEFAFTRELVETPEAVPTDVWLQVLSPCRKDIIRRTVDSVTGAKQAILSLYIASSDSFQQTIFGLTQGDVFDMTTDAVSYAKSITKEDPSQKNTKWNLMFSPEAFSDTDVEYSLRLCEAVKMIWDPTEDNPIILNLPATVEMSTPNTYADQVEIFSTSISERHKVCVSLHPHNDRGCAVAAAELGQMAGADRVEGCLFGNGERTGNVDLVTLILNLYSQGVDPKINLSDLQSVRRVVEDCTRIPVHPRAPYAGDLVFLAYSGSHQDAINKGFKKLKQVSGESKPAWKIPYLPIDPYDIGSTYESVIRVNSQSGKGGVAWTLQHTMDLNLPRGLQIEFSRTVKSIADVQGGEMAALDIANLFLQTYHVWSNDPRVLSANYTQTSNLNRRKDVTRIIEATVEFCGKRHDIKGYGRDIQSSVCHALSTINGPPVFFASQERTITLEDGQTHKVALVECSLGATKQSAWGANIKLNFDAAELLASLSSALSLLENAGSK